MKTIAFWLITSSLCLGVFFSTPQLAQAQPNNTPQINNSYTTAEVTQILTEKKILLDNQDHYIQEVVVKIKDSDQTQTLTVGTEFQPLNENQKLEVGAQVIVSKQPLTQTESSLVFNDLYRIPSLLALGVLFGILVIFIGGKKGAFSILGMVFSLYVLISFIVPRILAGHNPFLITLIGATFTSIVTMYVSHGLKRQTHLALLSMLICLLGAAILAHLAVELGHFVGLGSEEAAFLQLGATQHINLRGLLLAGILLGTLGILDDITLAQTAVIEQLKAVHPKIKFSELYARGLEVGKDHVASLVNTLVFAYAGTSLPLFLLFTLYRTEPAWVIINSEIIAEEIVRTLVGSIALVMAVPIATFISAYWISKSKVNPQLQLNHRH